MFGKKLKYFSRNKLRQLPAKPSQTIYKIAMSTSVSVVAEPRKIKLKKILSKKPVVKVLPEVPEKSVWLYMRRTPKEKPEPIVWEGIEDISDDENDTPQAAGKRLSTLKATRDRIQRRYYEERLDEFQAAGLFLKWGPVKPFQTHSNYAYDVQSTSVHSIRRHM